MKLWGDSAVTARIAHGPLDAVQARLEEQIALARHNGVQYWPLFLRDNGAHVGCCGLRPRDVSAHVYELGFHLRAAYFGKGLAVEAGRSVVQHAFHRVGAVALFAGHHPENAASRKVFGQLGFRHTHDELYPPTGLLHPSYWPDAPRVP